MALKKNPNYNPNDPNSQMFVFENPVEVVNQTTGQTAATLPITPQSLTPVAPIKVEIPEPTPMPPIPTVATNPTTALAPATPETPLSDLEKSLQRLTGADTEGEIKVSGATIDLQKQLNEVNRQIAMHTASALERQEKALASGETLGFAAGEAQRIARTDAIEAMKLAAISEALQGNITLATQQAQRASDAEYAALQKETGAKRRNLMAIYDTLTADEKKRADALLLELDSQDAFVKEQKAKREAIENIAIQAAATGKANNQQIDAIRKAKDATEAAQLASPFLQAKDDVLSIAEAKSFGVPYGTTKEQVYGKIPGVEEPSVIQPPIENPKGEILVYGTPEYIVQRLQMTGSSKTKPVASEREQLGKFGNVIAQTSNLLKTLDTAETGPIVGYLKSLNPYDFDARTVNAQVNALVPNVARGVYGEVGVLTDQDIERYLLTLPNIKSTSDQNKFVALMTLNNAMRSYEQTLLNLANSNVNVSGFVDSYDAISKQVKQLEDELNIGQKTEINGDEEAIFDDVVDTPKVGYWRNLWDALTGK